MCLDLSSKAGDFVVQKTCNDKTDNQRYDCDVVTRTLKRRRSDRCVTAGNLTMISFPSLCLIVFYMSDSLSLFIINCKSLFMID